MAVFQRRSCIRLKTRTAHPALERIVKKVKENSERRQQQRRSDKTLRAMRHSCNP